MQGAVGGRLRGKPLLERLGSAHMGETEANFLHALELSLQDKVQTRDQFRAAYKAGKWAAA